MFFFKRPMENKGNLSDYFKLYHFWYSSYMFRNNNLIFNIFFNISLLVFLFLAGAQHSFAQQFSAFANPNPVTEGDMFNVTFVLKADGLKFTPPTFKNFTLVSGPSTSSEFSFINGQTSRQMKYTYTLRADKKGDFTIDPATVIVNGEKLNSNPIKVSVLEPSQAVKEQRNQEADAAKSLNEQANAIISKNLFAKASISKNSAYFGEQLVATYKIYINEQLNIVDLSMSKMPSFIGFWTQSFDEKQLNYTREIINGVPFKVATVKKVVLLPQQNGVLVLDQMEFNSKVRLRTNNNSNRRRSIFDDFFNESYQDFAYSVHTEPIKVNIKPLPENTTPSFTGAVGNFSMEAWLDKTQTKENEPITLKVKISGNGNLKLIQPLNIQLPPGFESYEPKTIDNINVSVNGMNGNVVFEYLLIPRNKGEYKLHPVEFTYYDLAEKKYITLNSKEFDIQVFKGDKDAVVTNINKENATYLNQDIRFIKVNTDFSQTYNYIFNTWLHYSLALLPLLIFSGATYYQLQNIKLNNNQVLLKNKQATKVAQKRLKLAKTFLNENKLPQFYEELAKALWGYTSDKLSIPYSDLTKDIVKTKLAEVGVAQDTMQMLLVTIDDCEMARYAPQGQNKNPNDLLSYGQTVITEIEGVLK